MKTRDGGWAWLVLLSSFFQLFIVAIPFSIGMYINELIVELNVAHTTGGLFGACQLASVFLGGPSTYLSNRFSHRAVIFGAGVVASLAFVISIYTYNIYVLFITFALLPGLCVGTIFIQTMIIMNRYFDKFSSFANGVTLTGCGLGVMVIPHFYDIIIETYGWRQSLYVVAGITLQACVFAMLLRPISLSLSDQIQTKSQEIISKNVRNELLHNPQFYTFLVCNSCWSAAMSGVFVLGPNHFYERGMTNTQISQLMSILGVGNVCVRVALACILHFRKWNVVAMHASITGVMGVFIAMFIMKENFAFFALDSLMFGVTFGATCVTMSVVSRVLGGVRNYGTVYSWASGFCIIGIAGGPPLTGYIYDTTHSYELAFLMNSGLAVMGAMAMVVGFCLSRCLRTPATTDAITDEEITLEVKDNAVTGTDGSCTTKKCDSLLTINADVTDGSAKKNSDSLSLLATSDA